MAIKKCYRLWIISGFIDELPPQQSNFMYGIDEDYHSKKEWLKNAKDYTKAFNEKFNTNYTYQDFFGEPENTPDWVYCTKCGESFWRDQDHDCDEW